MMNKWKQHAVPLDQIKKKNFFFSIEDIYIIFFSFRGQNMKHFSHSVSEKD